MNHRSAASLAAAGFAAEGLCALAHRTLGFDGAAYDHLLDAAYAVAMAGSALGVLALARLLSSGRSSGSARALRGAGWVAATGFACMGVESAVGAVHRVDALGPLFTVGIALAVLGSLAFAILGATVGRPRWAAAVPFVAMVLAAAGGEVGLSLVAAAVWVAAAVAVPVTAARTRDADAARVA